jgi:predicted YcjX-like family ATPase
MRRRDSAVQAWREIAQALQRSESSEDQALARSIASFVAYVQHGSADQGHRGKALEEPTRGAMDR